MKFRLFGCEIYIGFLFAAAFSALLILDRSHMAVYTLAGIAVHELGHIFAMVALGQPPAAVTLKLGAIEIKKPPADTLVSEAVILAAGAAANLAAALVISIIGRFFFYHDKLLYIALAQIALAAVNLLPVRGLDGGSLFSIFLCAFFDKKAADIISTTFSVLIIAIILMIGTVLTINKTANPSILLFAVYLIMVMLIPKAQNHSSTG